MREKWGEVVLEEKCTRQADKHTDLIPLCSCEMGVKSQGILLTKS